nr:glycerophosphodiester phosphodiesterase family protein [Streptomyces spiramenti]
MHSAMTTLGSAFVAVTLALTAATPAGTSAGAAGEPSPAAAGAPAPDRSGGPAVVAHRGASGHAPENTLAAVDAAAELGVEWVEVDVQRAGDGELVVLHDNDLARTTDAAERHPDRAPWGLDDFSYPEIAELDAGSWYGPEFAGERVPTLGEVLDRMDEHGQKLLLEVKSPELYPGIEADVVAELREHGWLAPRTLRTSLVVQSFDAASVRTLHELAPRVRTGLLGNPPVARLADHAEYVDQINPRHTTVTADYVAAIQELRGAHGRKLQVNVWTVNDGPTAFALAGLGVDGIITDHPDVVRAALSSGVASPEPVS